MSESATSVLQVQERDEWSIRRKRWRYFQWAFALTFLGIVVDFVTTYIGFQRVGSSFEQNGIALYLIHHIGWVGVAILLVLTCLACLRSFKLVYWNLGLKWSHWLNILITVVCVFRWIVGISDAIWLINH